MPHTAHIWRALLVLVVILLLGVLVRHFMVPESFGEAGFYRYASLGEHMAAPLSHGSRNACGDCHPDQHTAIEGGTHASVSCEVCHAPLSVHASTEGKIADMPINRTYRLCALCHTKLLARPTEFPQVDLEAHLLDVGALETPQPIPARACLVLCHNPHSPGGSSDSSR